VQSVAEAAFRAWRRGEESCTYAHIVRQEVTLSTLLGC